MHWSASQKLLSTAETEKSIGCTRKKYFHTDTDGSALYRTSSVLFHGFQMYRTCSKSDIGRIAQIRLAECIFWRAAVYPIFQGVLSGSQVQKGLHTHSSHCTSSLMWWSPVLRVTQECQGDLFWDLSRAQEIQTPHTTPSTLLTAANWPSSNLHVWGALLNKGFGYHGQHWGEQRCYCGAAASLLLCYFLFIF